MFSILILLQIAVTLAWSPTNSYAPGPVDCPSSSSLTRLSDSLSKSEQDWLAKRNTVTNAALINFLESANMSNFDAKEFITSTSNKSIIIGTAFSGGGYRAMLAGAGQLAALDSRVSGANEYGLGGLLQSSTYLAGLSGGNWLVGTLAMNNWTDVDTILKEEKIWQLQSTILGYGLTHPIKNIKYWTSIADDIQAKKDAGYKVSITDIWGRALSNQFFPSGYADNALTWSTLRDADVFANGEMPFPISVADGRTPGTYIINDNSTIFEINPFELGSWDPSLYSFTDVKYLGSDVNNGVPVDGSCIGGFDNAGFIMGTSSSLFNSLILELNTSGLTGILEDIIEDFLEDVSDLDDDIANYEPNPFFNTPEASVQTIAKSETLFLCDGGEDNENIPFAPLIQPERQVDVIFAFDNSNDDDQWPDGASMVETYERQFSTQGNGTSFPPVPDIKSFKNLNLTARPAFFGCNAADLSGLSTIPPLVVYTANRPFTYYSNTSTFKLEYSDSEKRSMIKNGFETASRFNSTLDTEYTACVGCAIIRREQERLGIEQTDQCKSCFERYCWNGATDESDPGENYTLTGLTHGASDLNI